MRCHKCDYALWALPGRECPECGTPFVPSAYEFAPSSVQFCCPYCGQSYYGTSARGHLEPPDFTCARCGQHVHMDEMVLFPAQGLREEQTQPEIMPWLNRTERGVVRAWLATVWMALIAPSRLMRLTPARSSLGQAWWFAFLTWSLYALTSLGLIMLFGALMAATFAPRGGGGAGAVLLGMGGGFLVLAVLVPAVWVVLWGAVTHVVLRLTGRTECELGRTYQAHCYGVGALALMSIPCLGFYLSFPAFVWCVVSTILMIRQGQGVHGGRATLSVLALPLLSVGLMVGIGALANSATPRVMPAVTAPPQLRGTGTQQVLTALTAHARGNDGIWPEHALRLVIDGELAGWDLLAPKSGTSLANVAVGGTTLDQMTRIYNPGVIRRAVRSLPEPPVLHRLGDYVFTYHDIDRGRADGRLWLVVQAPYPGALLPTSYEVGRADGTVQTIPAEQFDDALTEQNALRAAAGLPPLPDPRKAGLPVAETEPDR